MRKVNVVKRGKVFQYKFGIAPQGGKRKFKSKSRFKTRATAFEAGCLAYNEYIQTGRCFEPSEISYSDYLDYWMKEHVEINLKYNTVESYRRIINIHLKPKLGCYKLAKITTATLQEFINKLYRDGSYSKNCLKTILSFKIFIYLFYRCKLTF